MTNDVEEVTDESKGMEKLRAALDEAASRYPYMETLMNRTDAVLVPNPDIHCFQDEPR